MQDLSADFSTPEGARKVVKLKAFSKFENTTEALAAAAALVDSKLSKGALSGNILCRLCVKTAALSACIASHCNMGISSPCPVTTLHGSVACYRTQEVLEEEC